MYGCERNSAWAYIYVTYNVNKLTKSVLAMSDAFIALYLSTIVTAYIFHVKICCKSYQLGVWFLVPSGSCRPICDILIFLLLIYTVNNDNGLCNKHHICVYKLANQKDTSFRPGNCWCIDPCEYCYDFGSLTRKGL